MADGATKFDSTSDYLTVTSANMDFVGSSYTVEFFYSVSNLPTADVVLFGNYSTVGTYAIRIAINSSGHIQFDVTDSTGVSMGSVLLMTFQGFNVWRHVAISGSGLSGSMYVDGTRVGQYTSISNQMRTSTAARISYQASGRWSGSISNLRVVKGSDLYGGSTLTVPTARLTAVTDTKLLTCVEHNSLTDQSGLNQTITQTGSPTPILSSPFTNYFGVISREDFNPYSNIPEQQQRWANFDNRTRFG